MSGSESSVNVGRPSNFSCFCKPIGNRHGFDEIIRFCRRYPVQKIDRDLNCSTQVGVLSAFWHSSRFHFIIRSSLQRPTVPHPSLEVLQTLRPHFESLLFCLFIRQFPRSASSPLLPDADHKRHTIMN
ncbi:hypothetical protein KC337_g67 [Hortaea werneckii]|nr:hypothetical protein KC337_g67 [Hortaea werneckii]